MVTDTCGSSALSSCNARIIRRTTCSLSGGGMNCRMYKIHNLPHDWDGKREDTQLHFIQCVNVYCCCFVKDPTPVNTRKVSKTGDPCWPNPIAIWHHVTQRTSVLLKQEIWLNPGWVAESGYKLTWLNTPCWMNVAFMCSFHAFWVTCWSWLKTSFGYELFQKSTAFRNLDWAWNVWNLLLETERCFQRRKFNCWCWWVDLWLCETKNLVAWLSCCSWWFQCKNAYTVNYRGLVPALSCQWYLYVSHTKCCQKY